MTVLLHLSEDPNILSIFGIILSLFIAYDIDKPFLVCKKYNNNYFDKHFQVYNVSLTDKFICRLIENLNYVCPTLHCITYNLCYIPK